MAKVVGPLYSSEARGRVGGLVFNPWRGAAVVKAKHAPTQPRSSLQLSIRALAVKLSRLWASNAFHDAWDSYAYDHPSVDGMGVSIRATGANWFLALNTRLLLAGYTPIEEPPSAPAPNAVVGFTANGDVRSLTVSWTYPTAAEPLVQIWFDGPHTAGRKGSLARRKFKVRYVGNETETEIIDLQPGTYTVFANTLSSSQGLVSPSVSADATVTG